MKKVIVIGSTGATGKQVVEELLKNKEVGEIVLLNRRKKYSQQSRLTEVVVDFDRLGDYIDDIKGDVAISCLGTTLKAAGSKENQRKVDVDYQYDFARLARQNGIKHFLLVSSYGANSKSRMFYPQIKGELEDKIKALKFEKLSIFRPPSLDRPDSDRKMEKVGVKIIRGLNAVGIANRFKPLKVEDLAKAIVKEMDSPLIGHQILEPVDIRKLLGD